MKKKKRPDKPLFDSIRKPTAPPSQKFEEKRTKETAEPGHRKAKHKKKTELSNDDVL